MKTARQRDINIYLTGLAISAIGSQVTVLALPWAVLSVTHSAAATSIVLLGESIPFATAGFALGPLLDRLSPRMALVGSDILRGLAIAFAGFLVLIREVNIPVFVAIGFLMGCGQVVSSATRTANVPLLASAGQRDIVGLNARIKTIRGGANLFGPPLGGFLVAVVGPAPALFLDAFSYAAAATCTTWTFRLLAFNAAAREIEDSSYIAKIRDGLRFIFRHRLVRLIVVQGALSNMLLTPLTGIILIVLVRESWHSPKNLGIILGALGLGALVGGIAISFRPALLPDIRFYGVLVLGDSLPFWTFLTKNFQLMVFGAFTAGIANIFLNTAGDTAVQRTVPADLRGRVFAPVVSSLAGVEPIGIAAAGFVIATFGVATSVRSVVLLCTVIGLVVTPLAWQVGSTDVAVQQPSKSNESSQACPRDAPAPGEPTGRALAGTDQVP